VYKLAKSRNFTSLRHSGAGTIFGQGRQDRERQNREHETEVYVGVGVSFCPENKRSPKKQVFAGFFERFLVPNMAHDTGLRGGGGSCPGAPKYLQGAAAPPTSRAYAETQK